MQQQMVCPNCGQMGGTPLQDGRYQCPRCGNIWNPPPQHAPPPSYPPPGQQQPVQQQPVQTPPPQQAGYPAQQYPPQQYPPQQYPPQQYYHQQGHHMQNNSRCPRCGSTYLKFKSDGKIKCKNCSYKWRGGYRRKKKTKKIVAGLLDEIL